MSKTRAPDPRELLQALLQEDSEDGVIDVLSRGGLWEAPSLWRLYGDKPGNWASGGNQQANAEAALVEKLTNSIDAVLMLECLLRGIDPRSPDAPRALRDAVAIFFDDADPDRIADHQGRVSEWHDSKIRDTARRITVALTGGQAAAGGPLCVNIADAGEGQAPERLPMTILSIDENLKQAIPFVQGKWNMGGTGALRFAGDHKLQLVVSRRHPTLAEAEGVSKDWGFTVVRRDPPTENRRVHALSYLAPVGAQAAPGHGAVLHFPAEKLPIFPDGRQAYAREAEWGTLIKLYNYGTKRRASMLRRGGLLERFDILLPGAALPVRLHECRSGYGGDEGGSFATTLTGLEARLAKSRNLEPGFPDSGEISLGGEPVTLSIFALRKDGEKSYKRNEGVLFVINGQTQAMLEDRFFRRKSVAMGSLQKSLLVVVDCTRMSDASIGDIFMNSRDRLAEDEPLTRRLLASIEDVLHRHEGLRELRERRKQEEISDRIADQRPLEEVLERLLRRAPSWAQMFLEGKKLANPFRDVSTGVRQPFEGKLHPTVFKFRNLDYGKVLDRDAHLGQGLRLLFETDVENRYFRRPSNQGRIDIAARLNGSDVVVDSNMHLRDGHASLSISLPPGAGVGATFDLEVEISDPTLVEAFVNRAHLRLRPEQADRPHQPGPRKPPRPESSGSGQEPRPSGISLPEIIDVYADKWEQHGMDDVSGLRAVQSGETNSDQPTYSFYVNMDNVYLKSELKQASGKSPELLRAKFRFGLSLLALGVLRTHMDMRLDELDSEGIGKLDVEDLIKMATDSASPIVLPMIAALGELTSDDLGEDETSEPDA